MSEDSDAETILAQADEREKEYNWITAAQYYAKALSFIPGKEAVQVAGLYEKRGYALHRAALQAERVDEFRERTQMAHLEYEKARGHYAEFNEPANAARRLRCEAWMAYLGYWLATQPTDKKRQLHDSWRLAKESLRALEESSNLREYGQTYMQLSKSIVFLFFYEANFDLLQEAVRHGEKAISFLSTLGNSSELAMAYGRTAGFGDQAAFNLPDPIQQKEFRQKIRGYWDKSKELSEQIALIELLEPPLVDVFWGGLEEHLTSLRRAMEYAQISKDRLSTGFGLEQLAFETFWKQVGNEDPEERRRLLKEALKYARDAREHYSAISFVSSLDSHSFWIEAPHAEYYLELASFETDGVERRELLRKAEEAVPELLKKAEDSGYILAIMSAHHVFSKVLAAAAVIEMSQEKKRSLLEGALKHRNVFLRLEAKYEPFNYWLQGVGQNYLANIQSELSKMAGNQEERKLLLKEALPAKESCLTLCNKFMTSAETEGVMPAIRWIGERTYEYGDLLLRFYHVEADPEKLRKVAEVFVSAAGLFQKSSLVSRMAESYWNAGQIHDTLREHGKAAEDFSLASTNYQTAASKIPQLKDFYEDYALYMQAWTEIEKARHHHSRQEYGAAREYYEKAAALHKSTKRWTYLTPNYSAWANLERAEDLSRSEKGQEAVRAFDEATGLFQVTQQSLQGELTRLDDPREKEMATLLSGAAGSRSEYCRARVAMEQAKILDREGDHQSSSEKYGVAAEIFERIKQAQSEQDQREIKLVATLTRAWQKMAQAEAEAAPELYEEASRLFDEAKEIAPNEKMKMLTLGHSRFCEALEAGVRFIDTRDSERHSNAVQNLQSAADYYLKAGFQSSSDFAKASKLLFDAYLHMNSADREKEPEKKTKYYAMAEKVLKASADSFRKAGYAGKGGEVQRLVEKVKEERELAASLTEIMYAAPVISSTSSFTTPMPTHEQAVGLERFEYADVQASVFTGKRDLKVGEDMDLELELVNSGRGVAQLVKMEEIIPEGFELVEKPDAYRVEERHLNMKGRPLGPLKTEEVKLILKPRIQGQFLFKPRILYLDENGKYKSSEPEPVKVSVKELGVSGWIRGAKR